ncbi:DNA primase [candidate division KSB1 bacterium]|nr:DNA primase [candidate division KSB1 bacterium]
MPYKIPEEKITEILDKIDIVDLISDYLTLKRKGKNFFGLCPFHHEKTPSFSVDPTKQMFHCFGCHKGGNAISFMMEHERMSFLEALEYLADRAGVRLEKVQGDDSGEKDREAIYYANKMAAEYFMRTLFLPAGKPCMDYIRKRGFDERVIRHFGLGYSLPAWDGLLNYAKTKSMNPDVLFKAGLVLKKQSGSGYYDRFRGRFMIPFINLSRKVVGFGGRILVSDPQQPKYLNTSDTPVFQKGNLLFNLNLARDQIRKQDQAIFVEGYTDIISLYQYGIENTVATSGTALTAAQAQLIKRYTNNIILVYDSDAAGSSASMRGADIFLMAGLDVRIATLPEGHDPDSFVREKGKAVFLDYLKHANSFVQFKIQTLSKQYSMENPDDRARIVHSLVASIAKLQDKIRQGIIVREIAEFFNIDERFIVQQITKVPAEKTYEYPHDQEPVKVAPKTRDKYDLAEEDIVRLLIEVPDLIEDARRAFDTSEIKDENIRRVIETIFRLRSEKRWLNENIIAQEISDPQLSSIVANLLSVRIDDMSEPEKLLSDCIVLLKVRDKNERISAIMAELKGLQKDDARSTELLKEYATLRDEVDAIRKEKFINRIDHGDELEF